MTTARSKIITDLRDDALMSRLSSEFTGTATIFQTHTDTPNSYRVATNINLDKYDVFCVFTSGGKDSLAALKVLLDAGVPKDKIEMHHHLVDGRESNLMDWDFMESYNLKVAKALGIKIYMSWLQGGFEGEMLKENSISQPCAYETPNGLKVVPRTSQSKPNTRRKFPQQSGQLRTRWCSSVLKIQLGSQMITSQERFKWKKVLYVSGERAAESSTRAKLLQFTTHNTDTIRKSKKPRIYRWVDCWKPVLHFSEAQVWELLADWGLIAPVPYRLSWSRSSCQSCIFNSDRTFATINAYFPEKIKRIAEYEKEFGITIARNGKNVLERALSSKPFEINDMEALEQATRKEYTLPIFTETSKWELPSGAFSAEKSGAD